MSILLSAGYPGPPAHNSIISDGKEDLLDEDCHAFVIILQFFLYPTIILIITLLVSSECDQCNQDHQRLSSPSPKGLREIPFQSNHRIDLTGLRKSL